MSRVFPAASWEQDYAAATVPFQLRAVHATPSFRRLLLDGDGHAPGVAEPGRRGRRPRAAPLRLRRHPARPLRHDARRATTRSSSPRAIRSPGSSGTSGSSSTRGSSRCGRSVRSRPSTRRRARSSCGARPSTQLLGERLLPDTFAFSGFVVVRATDVTDQEVLSAIERDLIDKESIVSTERFQELEDKLRTLLRRPALRLAPGGLPGRARLRPELQLRHRARLHLRGHRAPPDERLRRVRPRAGGHPGHAPSSSTISSLEPRRTTFEDALVGQGVRNILVAPLSLPGSADRHARAELAEPGRPRPREPDQAPRGAAALLDGGAAEPRRARGPRAGGHQGEVHGHPSLGGVAVPARRSRQHRGARRRGGHRARADRLPGRAPALRGDGHPRVVRPAEPRGPGRPGRSPPPGPRGRRGRARGPAAPDPGRDRLPHRAARPADRAGACPRATR